MQCWWLLFGRKTDNSGYNYLVGWKSNTSLCTHPPPPTPYWESHVWELVRQWPDVAGEFLSNLSNLYWQVSHTGQVCRRGETWQRGGEDDGEESLAAGTVSVLFVANEMLTGVTFVSGNRENFQRDTLIQEWIELPQLTASWYLIQSCSYTLYILWYADDVNPDEKVMISSRVLLKYQSKVQGNMQTRDGNNSTNHWEIDGTGFVDHSHVKPSWLLIMSNITASSLRLSHFLHQYVCSCGSAGAVCCHRGAFDLEKRNLLQQPLF